MPKAEVKCSFCGKAKFIYGQKATRCKNYFCNRECKGKWSSINLVGANGTNWQGGDVIIKCAMCGKDYGVSKHHYRLNIKRQCNHFCSYECRDKYRSRFLVGVNGANWQGGKKKTKCANCNETIYIKRYNIERNNNNFCSKKCKNEFYVGEQHYMWNNGSTYEPYTPEFNMDLKIKIRGRDNYTCQICNKSLQNKRIDIHHINYDKKNSDEKNLIALCVGCHLRTNFNRSYWTKKLQLKIADIYGEKPKTSSCRWRKLLEGLDAN